jgi:hypothetical protein
MDKKQVVGTKISVTLGNVTDIFDIFFAKNYFKTSILPVFSVLLLLSYTL